jgi:hypothetical protein
LSKQNELHLFLSAPRATLSCRCSASRCGLARSVSHPLVPKLRVKMRTRTLCVLPLEQSQTCEIWVPPSRAEAPRQDADSHAPRATLSCRCSASGCGFARCACFPSSRPRPARSGCHPPVPKLRVKMRTRTLREPPSRADALRRDAVLHALRASPRAEPDLRDLGATLPCRSSASRCGLARSASHPLVPMLCVGMRFCTLCVLPLEQSQTCEIWVPPSRAEAPRQDADSHALRAIYTS